MDDFSPVRDQTLKFYHQLGFGGDRSQIPAMIHGLQIHSDGNIRKDILLTLVRLHAMEALPAIDSIIQSKHDIFDYPYFYTVAARALLLAQEEQTPHAQVVRFFQELGESLNR